MRRRTLNSLEPCHNTINCAQLQLHSVPLLLNFRRATARKEELQASGKPPLYGLNRVPAATLAPTVFNHLRLW
jgi:hypothetical protein